MDDDTSSAQAPVETDSGTASAPEPSNNTAEDTSTESSNPQADNANADKQVPEPTGPAPDTNDPDLPDHGIDPDKGVDPDAGDAPTNPEVPSPADPNAEAAPDLKTMSRAERAEYFRGLETTTRKQVEQAVNQAYQPQPVDELTESYKAQGYDDFQAQILARETVRDQQAQINEARAEIAELNAGLATEAMEVVSTIDWLNPTKESSYDKNSANAASQLYEQLCVTKDERTGKIIEAKMSPMQFYSLMDNIRSAGSESSRLEAQKNAESQLAAVAPPSSNTTRRETPFDNLSAAQQREKLLAKGIVVT